MGQILFLLNLKVIPSKSDDPKLSKVQLPELPILWRKRLKTMLTALRINKTIIDSVLEEPEAHSIYHAICSPYHQRALALLRSPLVAALCRLGLMVRDALTALGVRAAER